MPIRSDRAHSRRIPNSIAFNFLLCLAIGRRFFLPRSNICSRENSVKFLKKKERRKRNSQKFQCLVDGRFSYSGNWVREFWNCRRTDERTVNFDIYISILKKMRWYFFRDETGIIFNSKIFLRKYRNFLFYRPPFLPPTREYSHATYSREFCEILEEEERRKRNSWTLEISIPRQRFLFWWVSW